MLVLSRKRREAITIQTPDGAKARIVILRNGNPVLVGLEAPKNWKILREEVTDKEAV